MNKLKIIDAVYRRHRINLDKPKFDVAIVNEMIGDAIDECTSSIQFGEWQRCPVCEGSGQILADGFTSSVYQGCPTCSGNRIVQKPIIQNN